MPVRSLTPSLLRWHEPEQVLNQVRLWAAQAAAAQLIWWQPADDSLRNSDRVIAQVLDLGTFEAGQRLRQVLGDRRLAQVLQRAEAGWFSPRSWNDWQQKLGLARSGAVPPLPRRHFVVRDRGDHAAA